MRGFIACIRKDIRLLLGSGKQAIIMLLLPLLLIMAIFFGMGDVAGQRLEVPTFSIAIRDEDNTIMSQLLIAQMAEIEIFEYIYVIENSYLGEESYLMENVDLANEEEKQLLDGVAALVTIPQDFFFALYDMRNYPIEIVLAENMPIETALFMSVITSVMDIISENQQTFWAVYSLAYGDEAGGLDENILHELYQEASLFILNDILERQGVFTPERQLFDEATQQVVFLYGAILAFFVLLIPLGILKTLSEEIKLGIVPRYIVAGGSLSGFIAAKAVAAFLLCVCLWLPLTILLFPFAKGLAFILFIIVFIAAFALFLFISLLAKEPAYAQVFGNILLLLFLLLGGSLYPFAILPEFLQLFSPLTIPYYLTIGIAAIGFNFSLGLLLRLLLPLLIASGAFGFASVLLLQKRGYKCK